MNVRQYMPFIRGRRLLAVQNFQSFAQNVMAEKIRNLRQSMAPVNGKAPQASQQQSHGASAPPSGGVTVLC